MLTIILEFIRKNKYLVFSAIFVYLCIHTWYNEPLSYTDLDFWTFWGQVSKIKTFNLFLISPVQGLGGYSTPISFWLNPIAIIAHFLGGSEEALFVSKFIILSLELVLIYLISIKLNFSNKSKLILLILYLLFTNSLLNTVFSFYIFENLVSISILRVFILINIYLLFNAVKYKSNIQYIYIILFVIWAVLINPMYYGIYFFYPTLIFGIFKVLFFLDTNDFKSFKKFIIITIISLLIIGIVGLSFSFNSARSVFGGEIYSEIQKFDDLNVFLLRLGEPISILFSLSTIFSCIYLIYNEPNKNIKYLSISILTIILIDFIIGLLYTFSGIIWKYPSPVYFEQSLIPFLLLPIAFALGSNSKTKLKKITTAFTFLLLICVLFFRFNPIRIYNKFFKSSDIAKQVDNSISTDDQLSQILKNNLTYKNSFNGSVSTLFFIPGSPVANKYGKDSSLGFSKIDLTHSQEILKSKFDHNLNLLSLWKLDIPTLEDNNHMVSPFKYFFFSRLLARPNDYQSRNWLSVTKFDKNIFRLLGVKYIITDYDYNLFLESKLENIEGKLNLYKLDSINTGNFNPTNIKTVKNANEFVSLVKDKNINFNTDVYIHDLDTNEISNKLEKATSVKFLYKDVDNIHFSAKTSSRSLIVLPLEYRHTIKVQGDGDFKIVRVNLFLTGIYFSGSVNLNFSSNNNFNIVNGLIEDKKDQIKYKLISDSSIKYPSNYQPYSIFKNRNLNIFSLLKPEFYIEHGGLWILLLIIFAETGLFLGFFFPGDSLLFLCGIYSKDLILHNFPDIQNTNSQLLLLSTLIFISAVLGNLFGYYFGKKVGNTIYSWEDNFFFKKKYLLQTNEFYNKNGRAAVFIARFMPIVRTFVPIVAGIVKMDFKDFMKYNIIGAFIWSFLLIFSGHYFQELFLIKFNIDLKKHIEIIIISIVLLSILPLIIKLVKKK
jgi:membrane-associated protein